MIHSCSYLKNCRGVFAAGLVLAAMAAAPMPMWGQWNGTNPVWTNSNVGIGTTNPSAPLNVNGLAVIGTPGTAFTIGSSYSAVVADNPGLTGVFASVSHGYQSGVQAFRADGTASAPTALVTGDFIGQFTVHGYTGTGFTGRKAGMLGWAAENWNASANGAYLTFETTPNGTTAAAERMRIDQAGNVGIGTSNPAYKLAVNGTIAAQEVIVTNTGWSDYVFRRDYRLRPLTEIDAYIHANHHLPDIPSEAEVKEHGVSVAEMQTKLLAKIEELTLHLINADKHMAESDERNRFLEDQNRELQERLVQIERAVMSRKADHK